MTDRELKKLTRAELLEMLLEQSRKAAALQEQLDEARAQLRDRQLRLDEAGNIAEAALQISGIFQTAQQAAEQYLDNIARLRERQESICREMERAIEEARTEARTEAKTEARAEADRLLAETEERCRIMEQEAEQEIERKYSMMIEKFKADAQTYWDAHGHG